MIRLKLNKNMGKVVKVHGYELEPLDYEIELDKEIEEQAAIAAAMQNFGLPALKDYHNWLRENGFDVNMPNPTNEYVAEFYGKKLLWSTEYSLGVVVKALDDDDYYIVMECSRRNEGFKYTQIILTPGGCM